MLWLLIPVGFVGAVGSRACISKQIAIILRLKQGIDKSGRYFTI
jgi:hypothetical protein